MDKPRFARETLMMVWRTVWGQGLWFIVRALMNEIVFYVERLAMDNPTFARETLMMVGPRPLVYNQGVDERDRFLGGALDHGQSHRWPW